MVDALRAALRLLPVVKPSLGGGGCGNCTRVPKARLHSAAPEQPALLTLKTNPQFVNCDKSQQESTGIVRFARAVLKYVGVGLSAVTANQFAAPSNCQAKELGSSVGENHMMAAAEARAVWQRTAANRHLVQEDAIRSPKFAHCPLPHIISKSQSDVCHPAGHSCYWSNSSWGSADCRVSSDPKLDLQWQLSPSIQKEFRSDLIGIDEPTCNRFCKPAGLQALAAESNSSLKNSAGLMGVASEYSTAADLELEWQLIVDSQPKPDFATTMYERKSTEEDPGMSFQESLKNKMEKGEKVTVQEMYASKVGASDIMTKNKRNFAAAGCSQEAGSDKEPDLAPELVCERLEVSPHHESSSKSSFKSSSSWRTADKEALAALVAQKAAERLENCDLPTPQTVSILRSTLSTFDIGSSEKQTDIVRSVDKSLLASLLCGNEPTCLETVGLPPSPLSFGSSDSRPDAFSDVPRTSQHLTIPSIPASPSTRRARSFSADRKNTSWSGGGSSSSGDRGSGGLLGEALCHSQTRAREAEKKVEQANKDKEQLVHLFFREASISLTYRQWVSSLQAENMWLRMYAGDEPVAWLQHSFFNPFSALERFSSNRWRNYGKEQALRQMAMDHQFVHMWRDKDLVWQGDTKDIMMGCTLGFAFALGISLAGAGLMLGWSMGWILLAY